MEKPKGTILIVDDESSIRESFKLILEGSYQVHLAATGESALKKLADEKIDLIFLDVRMPGMNGLETLKRIKEIDPAVEVVMVTAVNEVQKAGQAIKGGAIDYVIKPFDVVQITNMVETVLKKKAIAKESKDVRQEVEYLERHPILIGNSEKIQAIKNQTSKIAQTPANVLIKGEAGTEKDCVAKAIFSKSSIYTKTLMIENLAKNCSPQKLKELFFGKSTGSSTVSLEKQTGLLEKVNGGTLFICNLETLPLAFQGGLAEILRKQQFSRQDYASPIKFACRIIACTTADLEELTKEKKFDKNLLSLIAQEVIELPPLRSRSTDLPLFINAFIEEFQIKYNKKITGLSSEALDTLSAYPFPGNVQELKTLIEMLVLQTKNELIQIDELPLEVLLNSPSLAAYQEDKEITFDEMQKKFETSLIKTVIKKTDGDAKLAAQLLGIAPRVLATKLEPGQGGI